MGTRYPGDVTINYKRIDDKSIDGEDVTINYENINR